MPQVNQIKYEETKFQNINNDSNRFEACETVVEALCEQGLPKVFNPTNFITKIANAYGISTQEARTCLKLAINQLETTSTQQKEEKNQEKMYAQSGYFYPSTTSSQQDVKKDGMDSLSSLGSYNRLMFSLR